PSLLLASTLSRMVLPTSAAVTLYCCFVALLISTQVAPFVSQRSHWPLKVIGVVPLHLPGSANSVWSCWAVPWIFGSATFTGAARLVPPAIGASVATSTRTIAAPRRPSSMNLGRCICSSFRPGRDGQPHLPPAYFARQGDERKGDYPSPAVDDYDAVFFMARDHTWRKRWRTMGN